MLHVPRTEIPSEKWPLHIYMVKLEFKFLFPKLCGFSLLGRCYPPWLGEYLWPDLV